MPYLAEALPSEPTSNIQIRIHTQKQRLNTPLEQQIKHAVGSARSIARENNQRLDIKHIESVLDVVEAWNAAKALK